MFILRVYGILFNNKNQILLTDETYNELSFTKFPGGGMHVGEGTHECLIREFLEEFEAAIEVESHFYTTDFYQPSVFDTAKQVMSIYYKIKLANESTELKSYDSNVKLKWKNFESFTVDDVTFPIDKIVAGLLIDGK